MFAEFVSSHHGEHLLSHDRKISISFLHALLCFSGLDESIFVSPETMHLTLFMMRLTPDQEQEAVAKMQSLAPQIYDAVGSTCVTVRLQGLGE